MQASIPTASLHSLQLSTRKERAASCLVQGHLVARWSILAKLWLVQVNLASLLSLQTPRSLSSSIITIWTNLIWQILAWQGLQSLQWLLRHSITLLWPRPSFRNRISRKSCKSSWWRFSNPPTRVMEHKTRIQPELVQKTKRKMLNVSPINCLWTIQKTLRTWATSTSRNLWWAAWTWRWIKSKPKKESQPRTWRAAKVIS